jgi:hypothetical protein
LTGKTDAITENKTQVVSIFPESKRRQIIKNALAALTDISLASIQDTTTHPCSTK